MEHGHGVLCAVADVESFAAFIERQLVKGLGLRSARLEMADSSVPMVRPTMEANHELEARHQLATSNQSSQPGSEEKRAAIPFDAREFAIMQDGRKLGSLHVEPHGAGISGDTAAALEIICEQIPGAFDLCRLVEPPHSCGDGGFQSAGKTRMLLFSCFGLCRLLKNVGLCAKSLLSG